MLKEKLLAENSDKQQQIKKQPDPYSKDFWITQGLSKNVQAGLAQKYIDGKLIYENAEQKKNSIQDLFYLEEKMETFKNLQLGKSVQKPIQMQKGPARINTLMRENQPENTMSSEQLTARVNQLKQNKYQSFDNKRDQNIILDQHLNSQNNSKYHTPYNSKPMKSQQESQESLKSELVNKIFRKSDLGSLKKEDYQMLKQLNSKEINQIINVEKIPKKLFQSNFNSELKIKDKYFDSQRNSKFLKHNDINLNQYQSNNKNNSRQKHRKNQSMNQDFNQENINETNNILQKLGQNKDWSLTKNYKLNKKIDDRQYRPSKDQPQTILYLPSIKNLNNKILTEFIDIKTSARKDLMNSGQMDQNYLKHQKVPSTINIFPGIGMLSNKQTFTTHNQVDQKTIKENPNGLDEFDKSHIYHINTTDIMKMKNDEIQINKILINRKFKRIKQKPK